MKTKGQAEIGVGGLIALLILVSLGAYTLYAVTDSFDFSSSRTSTSTATENSTFSTDPSDSWDNDTTDNSTAAWNDNGIPNNDNWVGDNCGGGNSICFFYQNITVPAYDGITSVSVDALWSIEENENLEDIHIYVLLGRPGGDNVTVYYADNTTNEENSWQTVDNSLATTTINAAGTYYLYLYDNTTKASNSADNSVSARWDNASLTVVTYSQGYPENAVDDVEEQGSTTLSLITILAIVLVAALIIGVVMRSIGGAIGGGEGLVAPAL